MKYLFLVFIIAVASFSIQAQSCAEVMEYVKAKGYGTTYYSYNSDAISKVTFYEITADYTTLYFVIVCFKQKYSYSCSEYIYQVTSSTKMYYSMNYYNSAGQAFWKYIQPHNKNLRCGPDLN